MMKLGKGRSETMYELKLEFEDEAMETLEVLREAVGADTFEGLFSVVLNFFYKMYTKTDFNECVTIIYGDGTSEDFMFLDPMTDDIVIH